MKQFYFYEHFIDNTMKAITQGVITKSTAQYLKQYEERQKEITKQIAIEQSKETIMITEKEIRKYYQDALKLEPQMLINYLIKEIILFDNRADIYYNNPIKSTDSPDDRHKEKPHRVNLYDLKTQKNKADLSFCEKFDFVTCLVKRIIANKNIVIYNVNNAESFCAVELPLSDYSLYGKQIAAS